MHSQGAVQPSEIPATNPAFGLTEAEARERLGVDGPNRLPEPPRTSELARFLRQFTSPLVLTLVAAGIVAAVVAAGREGSTSGPLARFGDTLAIAAIVLLNALLGYGQEHKAEAALDALRRLTSPHARVRREGRARVVDASEIVPGDVVELEAGDAVPADVQLVETVELATEEATLTGESTSSEKNAGSAVDPGAPLAERSNMAFLGTTVVRGRGRGVVVATGARTELGQIGTAITSARSEPTPLERRLAGFGKRVLIASLAVSALLFAWGLLVTGRLWHDVLLEAVSFAVAIIPEGLPAITTITLALGMQRMAKRGAVVRRLPAVETLGATTVLCVDKTGTLTRNQMTARALWVLGQGYRVTGEGYAPDGVLVPPVDVGRSSAVQSLLETIAVCNCAELRKDEQAGTWRVIGDPMEGALLVLAAKGGISRAGELRGGTVTRELPFDSDRKRMTVVVRDETGALVAHAKGALETLLPLCSSVACADGARPLRDEDRAAILAEAERLSSGALRVLVVARRPGANIDAPEVELTFLGLVGLMDPPRSQTAAAVEACARAGIRVVMITGDHPSTARAIAREIGLWSEGNDLVTGGELATLTDAELRVRVPSVRVFARTSPEQKLRIVRAFKAAGEVVAMTGDGVNDAPALREAHIGVAMGEGGTDVARQAADLVITDDDFATIVEAIAEGRAIYRNIQKVIFFLLSSNVGLSVAVVAISLQGQWRPLTPLMILWINLVTNGLPALALGIDPSDPMLMGHPPRSAREGLLGARDYLGILFVGLLMGFAALSLYVWPPSSFAPDPDWSRAMAFTLLAIAPLFHAWSSRSPTQSIFAMRPRISLALLVACLLSAAIQLIAVAVPSLRPLFNTHAMGPSHWAIVVALSLGIVAAVELAKLGARLKRA
jgi:Ca2+-transporting ATPase